MNVLRRALAIVLINLTGLRGRVGPSMVVVLGMAGVVFIAVALLAMAAGLSATLASTGHADRALLLGAGSNSEINGSITREQAAILCNLPGIRVHDEARVGVGMHRTPLCSKELYASANLPRRDSDGRASLPLRGVQADALRVRGEVRIDAGRMFRPGSFEMIVGRGAQSTFAGLDIGADVAIKGARWKVVGRFVSGGSASESEAWVDVDAMAGVFRRGPYLNSVTLVLDSDSSLDTLRAAIAREPRLALALFRESDFYRDQASASTRLISQVGVVTGVIMALGALFAALNTLYSAIASRTREIATLKALGFGAGTVVLSVLSEALALSLLGAGVGALLAWLAFDGLQGAALGAAFGQVAFRFDVTPALLRDALLFAVALGFVGGLLPALQAARMNVVAGLRAS